MVDPFRSLMQLTASYVYNASNWLNVYHIDFIYWCWMVWLRTIIHEILNSLFPWKMCFIPSMFKFSCLFLTLIQKDFLDFCTVSVAIKFYFLQRQEHFLSANVYWMQVVKISKNRFTKKTVSEKKVKIMHILYMYT